MILQEVYSAGHEGQWAEVRALMERGASNDRLAASRGVASRSYPAGTVEALIALSHRTCYSPGCGAPVIVLVERRPRINLDVAHIEALNPGGPRYRHDMTNADRNSFWNLLLLCRPHHRHIDEDVKNCTVEMLKDWKRQAEVDIERTNLDVIQGVTEEQLEQIFSDAIKQHSVEIKSALDELKDMGRQNIGMLRSLVDKLYDSQVAGGYIDADRVSMLNSAAETLSRNFHDDNIGRFYDGAHTVARTFDQDRVTAFSQATTRLERLSGILDQIGRLEQLSRDPVLVNLPDTVTRLAQAVRKMSREY